MNLSIVLRSVWKTTPVICTVIALLLVMVSPVQASESETVTFTSAVLPRATDTSVNGKASRAVVRAFLKQHPDYVIEPFQMPSIEGAGMDNGPLMGIASGNPPHAIYVNFRQSSSYINHGFLLPLEVLLARIESDNEKVRQTDEEGNWLADPTPQEIARALAMIKSRVADPVWPVIYRDADVKKKGIIEGEHVWSLPIGTLVKALLYRKDVFKEAGLDPERGPEDWDELLAYCRKIKTMPNKFGLIFNGGQTISWGVYTFLVSNGVRYMERTDDGKWYAAFNTDQCAEAIYYILQLAKQDFTVDNKTYNGSAYVYTSGVDRNIRWNQGQIGMMFTYLDQEMLADINPELVGIAPIPISYQGQRGGELNCRMLGVFRGTTPQQQLAVMKYIWFITGDEAQAIRTKIFVENGYGRFLNPELLEKFGYNDILRRVPQGWRGTFETSMKTGVPEPYGRNTQFIYNKVSDPINWAMLESESLLKLPKEEALKEIRVTLDDAADRVNKYMLGELPAEEWAKRRTRGYIALAAILLLFGGSLTTVWRSFNKSEAALGDRPSMRRFIPAYLMVLPALAIVLFWQYGPVIMGLPLAMLDYELVIHSNYVGIDNFATILHDERFWTSMWNTFKWVILVVGLGFWPPIFVALLLDEVPTDTLKYFFRTIFYLPTIVAGIILVFLWRQLYEPSDAGFLNQIIMSLNELGPTSGMILKLVMLGVWLSLIGFLIAVVIQLKELSFIVRAAAMVFALALLAATLWPLVEVFQGPTALEIKAEGWSAAEVAQRSGISAVIAHVKALFGPFDIKPLGWIADPQMALLCVVIPGIWASAGPGCIIYLAALKTVPEELVEAASIDGAGIIQKMCYITLPRIKFLIVIQLVGAIVGAFKGGTNFILAMTGGGPNGATRVMGMDIFERTFMELQYGIGAAMAWCLGGLVIVLTAIQIKRMSRAEFKTADSTSKA